MKRIVLFVWLMFLCAGISYAQMDKEQINRMAGAESLILQADGWKVASAGLPLKFQLAKKFEMQLQMDGDRAKYIIMDGRAEDVSMQAARIKAIKNARKNILLLVDEYGADGNDAGSLELGGFSEVLTCYREIPGGKIEVMVELACSWENIAKAKLKQSDKRASSPVKHSNAIESARTL